MAPLGMKGCIPGLLFLFLAILSCTPPVESRADQIEEVNAKQLENLVQDSDYVAVFWYKRKHRDSERVLEELEEIDDDTDKFGLTFVKICDKKFAKANGVKTFPALSYFRNKEPIHYEGDLMDEAGVLTFLTSLEAMELPDQIEEVNAKILDKVVEDQTFVAVLFCHSPNVCKQEEYKNDCRKCVKALTQLENVDDDADHLGIAFVKINDPELADEYSLGSLPALVYYRHRVPVVYDGDLMNEEKVLEWMVANKNTGDDDDEIDDITGGLLNTLIDSMDHLAVIFYDRDEADDKQILQELENIDDELDKEGIHIVKICDDNVARDYGIEHTPALVYFEHEIPSLYDGDLLNEEEVLSWLVEQLNTDEIEDINDEMLDKLIREAHHLAVLFYNELDAESQHVVGELENIDDECDAHGVSFVKIDNEDEAKEYGITSFPTLVYFENSIPSVFKGSLLAEDEVLDWLIAQVEGDEIEEVTDEMLDKLIEKSEHLAVLFYDHEQRRSKKVIQELENIDDECDGRGVQFVKIDSEEEAKEYGLKEVPALVYFESEIPYVYQGDLMDEEEVLKWLFHHVDSEEIADVTDQMMDKLISSEPYLAVLFYDKGDKEDFEVLAELENIDDDCEMAGVPLIKIDNLKEAESYGIDDLPTLVYFENRIPSIYEGDLSNEQEVLEWLLQQKMSDTIEEVTDEILTELIANFEYVVVYFSGSCDDGDECDKILKELENLDDDTDEQGMHFVTTEESKVAEKHSITDIPGLVIFRNGEPIQYKGELSDSVAILEWLTSEETLEIPNQIEEVNERMLERLLNVSENIAVFFYSSNDKKARSILNELENIDDECDDIGIDFVKISDEETAKNYDILHLPALVYFRNKFPQIYEGDLKDEEVLLEWLLDNKDKGPESLIEEVDGSMLPSLVDSFEYLVVYFYDDNCPTCETILSELETIDDETDEAGIQFVKTNDIDVAEELGISHLPALVYFESGVPSIYDAPADVWQKNSKSKKKSKQTSESIVFDPTYDIYNEIETFSFSSRKLLSVSEDTEHKEVKNEKSPKKQKVEKIVAKIKDAATEKKTKPKKEKGGNSTEDKKVAKPKTKKEIKVKEGKEKTQSKAGTKEGKSKVEKKETKSNVKKNEAKPKTENNKAGAKTEKKETEPKVEKKKAKSKAEKNDNNEEPKPKVEKKEVKSKVEKKETKPKVEKKETKPKIEKKKAKPKVEKKDVKPKIEKKEAKPKVEKKKAKPKVEQKETKPEVEKKEAKFKVEEKEAKPKVEKKETKQKIEKKESKPTVEKKEAKAKVERKESKPEVEKKESKSKVEEKEAKPKVEKEKTKPNLEKKKVEAKAEKKESKPEVEKKETKPEVEKKKAKPKVDKKESKPKVEKNDAKPMIEKKKAKSKVEKKESKPEVQKKEAKPQAEKKSTKPEEKKEEVKPKVEKKETKPEVEKKKAKPKVDRKESKPKVEKKETEPKIDKKEAKPKVEEKEAKPKEEKGKTKLEVEKKKAEPKAEKKESKLGIEKKEAKPKVENKDTKPKVEKKESKPEVEKKEVKPMVEKKNAKPKEEKKEAKPKVEKKDSKPEVEAKVAKPKVEKKETEPKAKKKEVELKLEKENAKPKTENKEAKPKVEKKEAKPKAEKNEAESKVEKGEVKAKVEKKEAKPKVEKKEAKPKVEKKEATAKMEKKEAKPKAEPEETKPKVEKKEAKPKAEKKQTKPKAEKKQTKPKVEKEEVKPKAEKKEDRPKAEKKSKKTGADITEEGSVLEWLIEQRHEDTIENINRQMLYTLIDTSDYLAVYFFNEENTECPKVLRILEKIDDEAAEYGVQMVKMNDRLMAKKYGFRNPPGLVYFRKGKYIKYEGDLYDEEDVLDWLTAPENMELNDAIEKVNRKMFERIRQTTDYLAVFFYNEKNCKQCEKVLAELENIDDEAEANGIDFVKIEDPKLAKEVGVYAIPAIVFYRAKVQQPIIYAGGDMKNEENLLSWLLTEKDPTADFIEDLSGEQLVKAIRDSDAVAVYFFKRSRCKCIEDEDLGSEMAKKYVDPEDDDDDDDDDDDIDDTEAEGACGECLKVLEELENIDDDTDRIGVKFVKTQDTKVAERYGILTVPCLIYFEHGVPTLFEGDLLAEEEVLQWLTLQKTEDRIETINRNLLEVMVEETQYLAVFFYKPNCRACDVVLGELENIDDECDVYGIHMVKIQDPQLAKRYGIKTLPALIYFRNGNPLIFDGDIEITGMVSDWLLDEEIRELPNYIDEVNSNMLLHYLESKLAVAVFFFDEDNCDDSDAVLQELENIDDEVDMFGIDFVKIKDADAAAKFNIIHTPALVYFRKKIPLVYDGDLLDEEKVFKWLTSQDVFEIKDEIEEVNRKMLEKLLDENDFVAVYFYDNDCEECDNVLEGLENIDDETDGLDITFVKIKDARYAKKYGMQKVPALVYFRKRFPSIYRGDLMVEEEVLDWLQKNRFKQPELNLFMYATAAITIAFIGYTLFLIFCFKNPHHKTA